MSRTLAGESYGDVLDLFEKRMLNIFGNFL